MISSVTIWEFCETTVLGKKHFFSNFDCHKDIAIVDLSADSEDRNLYTFKMSYHKNKSSEDVKKIVAILESK